VKRTIVRDIGLWACLHDEFNIALLDGHGAGIQVRRQGDEAPGTLGPPPTQQVSVPGVVSFQRHDAPSLAR
jgi:hypothetical protein